MITFTTQKSRGLLSVSDAFATFRGTTSRGDYVFDLICDVRHLDAIKAGSTILRFTVNDSLVKIDSPLSSNTALGTVNSRGYVYDIVSAATKIKSTQAAKAKAVIVQVNVDVTAYVDNRNVNARIMPKKYVVRTVSVEDLNKTNVEAPLLTKLAHSSLTDVPTSVSSSLRLDRHKTMLQMIDAGIDPSHIVDLTHRSLTAHDSLGGLTRRKRRELPAAAPAEQLLNSIIVDDQFVQGNGLSTGLSPERRVQVLDVVDADRVSVSTTVTLPARRIRAPDGSKNVSTLYVDIELIQPKTGLAVESINRSIDIPRHVKLKNTPYRAPKINVVPASVGDMTLEISAGDDVTRSFELHRRQPGSLNKYQLVDSFDVIRGDKASIRLKRPLGVTEIYRVIPVGRDRTRGNEYTNVVVRPSSKRNSLEASFTPLIIENGIQLDVINVPVDASAIVFTSRDLTLHAREETVIGEPLTVIEDDVSRKSIATVDANVLNKHMYEYIMYSCNENGLSQRLASSIIQYERLQAGRVDTRVSDTQIGDDDVSFSITSTINDTTIDIVKDILEREDISRFYNDDVQKQRELLKRLIVHNVHRIDLNTGQRDDFGTITVDRFSDRVFRDKRGIDPPIGGHRYRYEIYVSLRSPETVIEGVVKNAIDPITKKPYSFKPGKFLHPVTIESGLIASKQGLNLRLGLDDLLYGSVGLTGFVDVSLPTEGFVLSNVSVERFDRDTLIVNWSGEGDVSSLDHFLVFKEVEGVRTVVGKAHSNADVASNLIVKLTPRDVGETRYGVIPVSIGYETLPLLYSNSIVLGD